MYRVGHYLVNIFLKMELLRGILFLFFIVEIVNSQTFNSDDLYFVNLVHRAFCGHDQLCTVPDNVPADPNTTDVRTLDELPVPVPPYLFPDCCQPCSCDTSTCNDYGTCCPDTFNVIPTLEQSRVPRIAACQKVSLKGVVADETYWVYRHCDDTFKVGDNITAADIEFRCEHPEEYLDMATRLPVIGATSQRTYANKFCGMCGSIQESSFINWKPRLACYEGAEFPQDTDIQTLVQNVLNIEWCDIEFLWPNGLNFGPPTCFEVYTECNVTGLWRKYDPLIEAACHAYRSVYNFQYNNVFCFQCNEMENVGECITQGRVNFGSLSFAAVLDFDRNAAQRVTQETDETSECTESQVYDHYKGICRNLTCTFPRLLQNSQCSSVGDSIIEVAYKFQLKFQPIEPFDSDKFKLEVQILMVRNYTENLLTEWNTWNAVADYSIFYKYRPVATMTTTDIPMPLGVEETATQSLDSSGITTEQMGMPRKKREDDVTDGISGDVTEPSVETPPELPTEFLPNFDDLFGPINILEVYYILWEVKWYFRLLISNPHSADFLDTVLDQDGRNVTLTDPVTGEFLMFHLSVVDFPQDRFSLPRDPVEGFTLDEQFVGVPLPDKEHLNPIVPKIQTLKPALVCPTVSVDNLEYNITDNLGGILIKELNQSFDNALIERHLQPEAGKVIYSICKDNYIAVTDMYRVIITTEPPKVDGVTPQGVMSVVCACISILCALLTFLTYILFAELRTQPGVNNMILCISVICAQTLFTFAVPQFDNVNEAACSFIGGLVHFFWLMVVFSMNVCCYHMVMVFIGHLHSRKKTGTILIRSILYTTYCVLASLVFVSINIIVAVVDTNNSEKGYGNGICYISKQNMVGYTFALPLGLVILANIIFFVIVIVKISRAPTISASNKKDRNYFKIYAKLSTLTGLTWIFGFLFEFTEQVVFEYLFIIFNGGIGVLIFISFVCNKRNYKLFMGKFKSTLSKDESSTGTTRTREIELEKSNYSKSTST